MKKKKITITFIAGCILAFVISFSHFLEPVLLYSSGAVTVEESKEAAFDETQTFITLPSTSIPSFSLPGPFHLQSNFPSHFLFEIFVKEDKAEEYVEEASLFPSAIFKIVFNLIIAPNGP
jgi:hypothetical protein